MKPTRAALSVLAAAGLAAAVSAAAGQTASIVDLDGRPRDPFKPSDRPTAIFFVATDCPISNAYAPEIQRICKTYATRGVSCLLVYENIDADAPVKEHLREYRYANIPVVIDRDRRVAKLADASITPQAVLIDREGKRRYHGRIDNWYVAFGKRRPEPTEHDLRDAIDAVLERRPVPRAETEALGCYIVDPAILRK